MSAEAAPCARGMRGERRRGVCVRVRARACVCVHARACVRAAVRGARTSSVVASAFFCATKRLSEFSEPRYVSSSRKATLVIQLAAQSRASSMIAGGLPAEPETPPLHWRRESDFIRSPTRMKSPRTAM